MKAVCVLRLSSGLLAAALAFAACGGNTGNDPGSGGSGASAGIGGGGGGGVDCQACSFPLIHAGDACSSEGDCCAYAGQCPLIYSCTGGAWKQEASSNCGYAVPCGDQGLGCPSWAQCSSQPTSNGTSYSCEAVSDAGADALPACGCLAAPPKIGDACACSGACGYLICPAGEMHTIDCVNGQWTITGYAWDYTCKDAG